MGLLGNMFGSSDEDSQKYLDEALKAYKNINVPTVQSGEVKNLPQETVQGTVNPEEIQVDEQAPNAYNDISLDPTTRQAQMNALAAYQEIANSGGLDANAKLAIQQAIDAANEQSKGAQGAIMNQAQAEGQGGGDFALTQRAIAAQGASNTAANAGMAAAAEAEKNREDALTAMSNIGGSINASDYGQAQAKANAANTINASNTGYKNAANTGNVANNMAGQQFNVTNAQGVNAANTTAGQNNAYYNASLPQQQFNNELAKASGQAGVNTQQANTAQSAANANSAFGGSLLGTAGTVGAAYLGGPAGLAASKAVMAKNTPNNNASAGTNAAHGGVIAPCYSSGGLVHDHSICMKLGGMVGGRAQVEGDSETNDTVPALLSPGELVIPRSVPKDGEHMEKFAEKAPVAGTNKKVDLGTFTKGYKKGKK